MAFITETESGLCKQLLRIELQPRNKHGLMPFTVDIDATPLLILAEAAALGDRVYELATMRRPGDVLHYLHVRLVDVHSEIQERVNQAMKTWWSTTPEEVKMLPYLRFDKLFFWQFDDTTDEARCWLYYRDSTPWKDYVTALFTAVSTWQQRLRAADDYLIQRELALIDQSIHRCDYEPNITRYLDSEYPIQPQTELPESLFNLIKDLIQRDTVNSVSCPFTDHHLWRLLVGEQVRRAERLALPPQTAFELNGPDSAEYLGEQTQRWGGEVHIPYEGTCEADLFIKPRWFQFNPEHARQSGELIVKGKRCHYLLTQEDYGEIECATRSVFDGWVLYEGHFSHSFSFVNTKK